MCICVYIWYDIHVDVYVDAYLRWSCWRAALCSESGLVIAGKTYQSLSVSLYTGYYIHVYIYESVYIYAVAHLRWSCWSAASCLEFGLVIAGNTYLNL